MRFKVIRRSQRWSLDDQVADLDYHDNRVADSDGRHLRGRVAIDAFTDPRLKVCIDAADRAVVLDAEVDPASVWTNATTVLTSSRSFVF